MIPLKFIYVIRDNVSRETSPLILAAQDKEATRTFAGFLSNTQISPTDYDLYRLGSFDGVELTITETGAAIHVVNGAAVQSAPVPVTTDKGDNHE